LALISDLADQRGFAVEFSSKSRVYIEDYGSSLDDIGWEEKEIELITSFFPDSHQVYSIAYRGIEAAKKAIIELANSDRMLVDNDFGTLMSGQDFVHKVLAEPDWYWFDDLR
jgi:hypothetical protein